MGVWTPGPGPTEGADIFIGTGIEADAVDGLGGDDRLEGGQGADTLRGGDGNDFLYSDTFNVDRESGVVDALFGGAENDRLHGGLEDFFDAGDGGDIVTVFGRDFLSAPRSLAIDLTPNDTGGVVALPLGGVVLGNAENIFLSLRNFSYGGDIFFNNLDHYTLIGSDGPVSFSASGGGSDLDGRDGDDFLSGWTGADIIRGGGGNDLLTGEGGADQLFGGDGNDVIRGFRLGRANKILIDSNTASDLLDGGDGDDFLIALPGDTIIGGAGFDTLNFDFDTVFEFSLDLSQVTLSAGVYSGPISGSLAGVQKQGSISGVESLVVNSNTFSASGTLRFEGAAFADRANGGSGNDRLFGNAGADILSGLAGNDELDGGADNDSLSGDDGDDVLRGGLGGDFINGGAGLDLADYASSSAPVSINLGLFTASGGEAAGDTLLGVENLRGSAFGDTLTGDGSANTLSGIVGADILTGGLGNDFLYGESSSDILLTGNALAVRRLYLATLDRAPDPPGWAGWIAQLDAGVPLATITTGFIQSPEFQAVYGALNNTQFVTLLYNNVLHRAPDTNGLNGWLNVLNTGGSRESVVNGFSQSVEFILGSDTAQHGGQVYRLYGATLDRAPDPTGFAGWTNALANNDTLDQIAGGFVNSVEFQTVYGALDNTQFVTLLYANVLNRAPDPAGLNGWLSVLAGGASRTSVVLGFSESGEYQTTTRAPYVAFASGNFAASNDTLNGGAGDDLLSGGVGADTFVFTAGQGGTDTIYGLETIDEIQLVGFGYTSVAQAQSRLTQVGSNLVFSDQGQTIVFANFTLSNFPDDIWGLA